MAVSLLAREVSDLTIGKPPLRPLPITATVGDALAALRRFADACLSVWAADHSLPEKKSCVGKLCVVDVVCFLCDPRNLAAPAAALASPVSALLSAKHAGLVRRVEPHYSVLEALDVILDGAQNLVVPIRGGAGAGRKKTQGGGAVAEFCWLTQEDFVRYFLNSIALFSPAPALSVATLGLVRPDVLAVRRRDPALSALPLIRRALAAQTSVAVLSDDGVQLVGEISPSTLAGCDVGVAAALAALSAGDFMAYIDCAPAPPEAAVDAVRARLVEKGLSGMLELLEEGLCAAPLSSSSSDEENAAAAAAAAAAAVARRRRPRRQRSYGSYSSRMGRRSEEAIVCHPESSLVAVMIQALAHRVSYVWVVDDDYALVGVVTFPDVLRVFREQLQ